MKRLLLGIAILSSVSLYANEREDMVEKNLLTKYPALVSGVEKVDIHEYDVDIKKDKIKVKIELKGKDIKKEYEKLKKGDIDKETNEISKYIKDEIKESLPIKIKIEIDNEVLPDEIVYRNIVK